MMSMSVFHCALSFVSSIIYKGLWSTNNERGLTANEWSKSYMDEREALEIVINFTPELTFSLCHAI